jgi:hypothetical protein
MKLLKNDIPAVDGALYYIATASVELQKRIEDELTIPDPPKEVAKALLSEAYEKADRDPQGTP